MSTIYRLILSALLAAAATAAIPFLAGETHHSAFDPTLFGVFFITCAIAALISPAIKGYIPNINLSSSNNNREQGKVKWFNVSKGYGFVTRPSGEEIFVHFRSIQGKGRRVLREGQTVEYVVGDGEKGPQAEDVETVS